MTRYWRITKVSREAETFIVETDDDGDSDTALDNLNNNTNCYLLDSDDPEISDFVQGAWNSEEGASDLDLESRIPGTDEAGASLL
jgi:hypothetical protein